MSGAKSADRALAVLTLLSGKVRPLPAAAIARACGLPRSSAYALLHAMARRGFVVHYAEERAWGLGPAALDLASPAQRRGALTWPARPIVAALARATGATGELGILEGSELVHLLCEPAGSAADPTVSSRPGVRLPAHRTALGRAALMHLGGPQLRALYPPAGAWELRGGTLAGLERELAAERRSGYAVRDGTPGGVTVSVAAPVFGRDGRVTAALGVSLGHGRRPGRGPGSLAPAVVAAAEELSERLGGARADAGPVAA